MNDPNQNIALLRALVEESSNCKAITSNDFIYIAGAIQGRINKHLGISTLKRIWGYIDGYKSVRESTLDILSQFVGYPDYETFVSDYCDSEAVRSSHRVVTQARSSSSIPAGAHVEITWNPNRSLVLLHKGNGSYIVKSSLHSKVTEGDSFEVQSFIMGQPLVLSDYIHNGEEPCHFMIGNKGGLTTIKVLEMCEEEDNNH